MPKPEQDKSLAVDTEGKAVLQLDTGQQKALWDFDDAARARFSAGANDLIKRVVGMALKGELTADNINRFASKDGMDAIKKHDGNLGAVMKDLNIKPADAKSIDADLLKKETQDFMSIVASDRGRALAQLVEAIREPKNGIDKDTGDKVLVVVGQRLQRKEISADNVTALSENLDLLKDRLTQDGEHIRKAINHVIGQPRKHGGGHETQEDANKSIPGNPHRAVHKQRQAGHGDTQPDTPAKRPAESSYEEEVEELQKRATVKNSSENPFKNHHGTRPRGTDNLQAAQDAAKALRDLDVQHVPDEHSGELPSQNSRHPHHKAKAQQPKGKPKAQQIGH